MSDYAFVHEGRAFTPNQTAVNVAAVAEHNAAIEARELEAWKAKPDRMPAYYKFPADVPHTFTPTEGFPYRCDVCKKDRGQPSIEGWRIASELCKLPRMYQRDFRPCLAGAVVTTWTGKMLGAIVDAHVYRHNFGGRFVSLTVKGTNGAMYHGRASFDWGECVWLRKGKATK